VEKARTNTLSADDLVGANVHADEPRRAGNCRVGPRLMSGGGTIVATGSIAYPVRPGRHRGDDRRREGHDDDLGRIDHRVIQGAESGRFLGRIEEYLQGERGFYEGVFASLGVELGPLPPPPAPAAAASAARAPVAEEAPVLPSEELLQGRTGRDGRC